MFLQGNRVTFSSFARLSGAGRIQVLNQPAEGQGGNISRTLLRQAKAPSHSVLGFSLVSDPILSVN